MDSPRRTAPSLNSTQRQQQPPPVAEEPLPQHPGYLVLPSAYLRPLHAIRKAGGAVVWLDLVTKVNKVKRQQQRLVILTQTHLYSCLPDEGDIQRCLPLAAITAAHLYVPASASISANRRSKSVFGSPTNANYTSGSFSAGRDDSSRSKCEVLLICPSEYDLLFFVNDNTFQHFLKALTAPQDPAILNSPALLHSFTSSNSFAVPPAANGSASFSAATANQSFATSQYGSPSSSPASIAMPSPNGVNAAGAAVYVVPIIEVPQPLLQTPSLIAKARLEKPAKYNRTKAARFVTVFPKLIAPPQFDYQGPAEDDLEESFAQTRNSVRSDGGSTVSLNDKGKVSSSVVETRKRSDSPTAELLDDKALQRRVARQRAISVHIPLPDEKEKAAQDKKVAAAKIEEVTTMAGPVAIPKEKVTEAEEGDNNTTPSASPKQSEKATIALSDLDADSDVEVSSGKEQTSTKKATSTPVVTDHKKGEKPTTSGIAKNSVPPDEEDDLITEMDQFNRERAAQRRQQQQESSPHDRQSLFSTPARPNPELQTRWSSPSANQGPSQNSGPTGSREGWLAVLKAHKAQNDALRKIIAELQIQVTTLAKENAALKGASNSTTLTTNLTVPLVSSNTMAREAPTQPTPSGSNTASREVDLGEI